MRRTSVAVRGRFSAPRPRPGRHRVPMAAQARGAGAQGAAAAAEPLPAGVTPAADARRLLSRDTLRALVQHVLGEQARPCPGPRGPPMPR